MRRLDTLTAAELRQAVRTVMQDKKAVRGTWRLYEPVARELGADFEHQDSVGASRELFRQFRIRQQKFASRVSRAADQLAAEGILVKVGRGECGPDGVSLRGFASYYLPQEYRMQQALADREHARLAEQDRRWGVVRECLAVHGYKLAGDHSLSLADWEDLVRRLALTGSLTSR